ncbi:hypothetical protein [Candidatus Palauibacter sp.]|uniref:hypothetical protein n=1 Tax=Candidatus Palauibacter sp. TaxID=3101350 RepID=UPI003B01BB72
MGRSAALFMAVIIATACLGPPQIMTRPASVAAGGLDCVGGMLRRLGYIIMDGDRSLGFIRAERDRPGAGPDVLVVNYIIAGTADNEEDTIQVRASRVGKHREMGPRPEAISDAEGLLDRCGKL